MICKGISTTGITITFWGVVRLPGEPRFDGVIVELGSDGIEEKRDIVSWVVSWDNDDNLQFSSPNRCGFEVFWSARRNDFARYEAG